MMIIEEGRPPPEERRQEMTTTELKKRIEKKEDQINRKFKTMEKKKAQIIAKSKKVSQIEDEGERRWLQFDIEHLEDDLRRLDREIQECSKTLEKYEMQLEKEELRDEAYIKEVPEELHKLEEELIERWDEWDIKRRDLLKRRYDELGHREWWRVYSMADRDLMYSTDTEIHENNVKDSKYFVLDLLNRVKAITGNITEWGDVHLDQGNQFPLLTGWVRGDEGSAKVETILAGGHNIQRLHIRTLVKGRE